MIILSLKDGVFVVMKKRNTCVIMNPNSIGGALFQDLKSVTRFRNKFGMTILVLLYFLLLPQPISAASLSTAKDTISTSRPSASAPLGLDQAASTTSVTFVDNGSMFLASDSAIFLPDAGESINVGMTVSSMSASTVTTSGPVGWWKLDDGSGSSAFDASGNSHNGTLSNSPTWTTGKYSGGLSFNGGIQNVDMGVGGGMFDFSTSTDFTFAVWVKAVNLSNTPFLIDKRHTFGGTSAGYSLHLDTSGRAQLRLADGSTVNSYGPSTGTYTDSAWHHYVVSVSRTGTTVFYIDGIQVSTANISSIGNITNALSFQLATKDSTAANALNGLMDDVRVYNYAINSQQALSIYNYSAPVRNLYFSSTITNSHHWGDPVIVPITAKHTLSFTTITGVASSGKVVVTFPGTGTNSASPSASTFAFNNLQSSNIITTGASCGSYTLSPPTITCNLNAALSPGTLVTMTIGSTTPALVNPTKSAVAGTSDPWQLTLQTTDSGGVILDSATIRIATIDSITVRGEVDPSITFTIAGVNNGVALSTQATGCADSTANVPNSTASEVSLGFLRNGQINLGAQLLTVSTNGSQGYAISATSSGKMINPSTGYGIYGLNGDTGLSNNDTPVPAVFRASGLDGFGISACGPRINTTLWGATSCTTTFSSGCKYANPWNTGTNSYYDTIASYSGGPVSNDATVVKYGGTISGTTPPGTYRTVFTYVATATF